MTSIIQLRNAYQAGTLPKPYFLGAVYALTQSLVEFQDALKVPRSGKSSWARTGCASGLSTTTSS